MEMGYIYVVHTGDAIQDEDDALVLKVGRTKCLRERIKQYPKGSILLRAYSISNQIGFEDKLHQFLSDNNFKQRLDYGTEYYQPDSTRKFLSAISQFVDSSSDLPEYLRKFEEEENNTRKTKHKSSSIHDAVLTFLQHSAADLADTRQKIKHVNQLILKDKVYGGTIKYVMAHMLKVALLSSNSKNCWVRDVYEFPQNLQDNLHVALNFHKWFSASFRITANTHENVDARRVHEAFKLQHAEDDIPLADVVKMASSYGALIRNNNNLSGIVYIGSSELPSVEHLRLIKNEKDILFEKQREEFDYMVKNIQWTTDLQQSLVNATLSTHDEGSSESSSSSSCTPQDVVGEVAAILDINTEAINKDMFNSVFAAVLKKGNSYKEHAHLLAGRLRRFDTIVQMRPWSISHYNSQDNKDNDRIVKFILDLLTSILNPQQLQELMTFQQVIVTTDDFNSAFEKNYLQQHDDAYFKEVIKRLGLNRNTYSAKKDKTITQIVAQTTLFFAKDVLKKGAGIQLTGTSTVKRKKFDKRVFEVCPVQCAIISARNMSQ